MRRIAQVRDAAAKRHAQASSRLDDVEPQAGRVEAIVRLQRSPRPLEQPSTVVEQ